MIRIEHLVKRYGEKAAIDDLSLEIGSGVVFGLLGPNGAGKTTLVNLLNGLCPYEEGDVEVFGLELRAELAAIRKQCAYIPQSLALYENLTVMENLRFFAAIHGLGHHKARENIDKAVHINRLETMLDQKAATLSGGQQRRLNIAIGLLNDPKLLYFDEPTVGIDPESRNDILESIRALKEENKTIVYTSHYMPEIEKICDEVAIMAKGKVVRHDSLQRLLEEENVGNVVFETYGHSASQRETLLKDAKRLYLSVDGYLLNTADADSVASVLRVMEAAAIPLKQVRYGGTNLESLFIALTSEQEIPRD